MVDEAMAPTLEDPTARGQAPDDTPTGTSRRDTLANVASAVVVGLGVLVYVVLAVRTGLSAGDAALSLTALLVTQVLPGVLVWRCVRPRAGWLLEDLAAGFAVGSALSVPVQIIAGLSHQRWPAGVLPLALAVVLVALPVT